jgi:formate dehydrogenase subunit beta
MILPTTITTQNTKNLTNNTNLKTFVFKSALFDHDPMQYVTWTRQKGACQLPSDTLLFHLTRLNHMALSCVGCGMCTEACPSELPVGMVFRAVGYSLQAAFDYAPGRSLEDPLPLVTFKADEWAELGE